LLQKNGPLLAWTSPDGAMHFSSAKWQPAFRPHLLQCVSDDEMLVTMVIGQAWKTNDVA
jgi:hypothetical protein